MENWRKTCVTSAFWTLILARRMTFTFGPIQVIKTTAMPPIEVSQCPLSCHGQERLLIGHAHFSLKDSTSL